MTEDLTVLLHLDLMVRNVEQGSYKQIKTSKHIDALHMTTYRKFIPTLGGEESRDNYLRI